MMREKSRFEEIWITLLGLLVVLVFGFLLFAVRESLNPFLLYLLLVGLLIPFRSLPGRGLVVVLATLMTLFWVLDTTGFLLAPFVLALVLSYVLDPAVDILERRMNRSLAIGVLALPLFAAVVLLGVFGLPALGSQIGELIDGTPALIGRLDAWLQALGDRLTALGLPAPVEEYVTRLTSQDPQEIVAFLEERQAVIVQGAMRGLVGGVGVLGSALSILGYVVLTPVLTFYLLRDWDKLTKACAQLIPEDNRDAVVSFARDYDHLVARYLRGQLTVAVVVGAMTTIGLWALSFPYALLLGVLVAVFGLVPYLGLVLSLIPAVLVALLSGAVASSLLKVAVVYGVAQTLEGSVISPRIVGESVGLHPVWVVFALAVGGFYFGFVGLLVGVPGAVGAKLLVERGIARYRASSIYKGATPTHV